MATKLTRPTHKISIQLQLSAIPFAVLAPGGQSGNFRIQLRKCRNKLYVEIVKIYLIFFIGYNICTIFSEISDEEVSHGIITFSTKYGSLECEILVRTQPDAQQNPLAHV